jgi:hypothetical protein
MNVFTGVTLISVRFGGSADDTEVDSGVDEGGDQEEEEGDEQNRGFLRHPQLVVLVLESERLRMLTDQQLLVQLDHRTSDHVQIRQFVVQLFLLDVERQLHLNIGRSGRQVHANVRFENEQSVVVQAVEERNAQHILVRGRDGQHLVQRQTVAQPEVSLPSAEQRESRAQLSQQILIARFQSTRRDVSWSESKKKNRLAP